MARSLMLTCAIVAGVIVGAAVVVLYQPFTETVGNEANPVIAKLHSSHARTLELQSEELHTLKRQQASSEASLGDHIDGSINTLATAIDKLRNNVKALRTEVDKNTIIKQLDLLSKTVGNASLFHNQAIARLEVAVASVPSLDARIKQQQASMSDLQTQQLSIARDVQQQNQLLAASLAQLEQMYRNVTSQLSSASDTSRKYG
jgi:gas vesicle protein